MEYDKRKVRWTLHALERAAEANLKTKTLLESWERSEPSTLSKKQQAYKFKVYGMESLKNVYFWDAHSQLLFTTSHSEKFNTLLVITVTKGRGNLYK